jgi:DNA-directed RNA polymerase specialized sigma24 family protein
MSDREPLGSIVERARAGDVEAFARLVRRFQAMAYGYAYSVLGDFPLAEDAAQEAFLEVYRKLGDLREPAAFPGWFRRIVFKHCDRITLRRRFQTVSLDVLGEVASRALPLRASPPRSS